MKAADSKVSSGLKSRLRHLIATFLWASYFTFLWFNCFMCKMGKRALNPGLLRFLNEIITKRGLGWSSFSSFVPRNWILHDTGLAFVRKRHWPEIFNDSHTTEINDQLYPQPTLPILTGANSFCSCCLNSAAQNTPLQQATPPGRPRGNQNTPIGNQNPR